MKVLITLNKSPSHRYLVQLITKALIQEVRDLVEKQKHSQAINTVFTKGAFEKEIREVELPMIKADLILSEDKACWDLTE